MVHFGSESQTQINWRDVRDGSMMWDHTDSRISNRTLKQLRIRSLSDVGPSNATQKVSRRTVRDFQGFQQRIRFEARGQGRATVRRRHVLTPSKLSGDQDPQTQLTAMLRRPHGRLKIRERRSYVTEVGCNVTVVILCDFIEAGRVECADGAACTLVAQVPKGLSKGFGG